jgi:hypothetical protein
LPNLVTLVTSVDGEVVATEELDLEGDHVAVVVLRRRLETRF